ncbi:MAG TPA: tetratricopeptide repeat protein [Steroidobacteraceae bacterium]|nr:tetratricopeptide repeat protein [Steroidobacteraceae bacterium]
MSEYLSEKEQWEQIRTWVRENGLWVLAGLAVGGAILGGWRWWQAHLDAVGVQASARYTQLIQALERSDRTMAFVQLGELERNFPSSPYADQGRLVAARIYVEGKELGKAAEELAAVMQHSRDRELALVARQRLARVEIAQGKPDEALATLDEVQPGAFASRYHEARGDAYYAKGDKAAALREYRAAESGGDLADSALLGLKIADLAAALPAAGVATSATSPPSPATTGKPGAAPAK